MPLITAVSLGWGVQSFTLVAMSIFGDLPKPDLAIHSDTHYERANTYAFKAKWESWLAEHGIEVVTVSANNYKVARRTSNSFAILIPAYTLHEETIDLDYPNKPRKTGRIHRPKIGQLRRQCTDRWKIEPMRRYLNRLVRDRSQGKLEPGSVELWLGISKDEFYRAKDSDVQYIKHRFPLLELHFTRADCIAYLRDHGLEIPGKSSCTFCPYHSIRSWESLKRENGPDYRQAVEIDQLIRDKRPPDPLFIHPNRKPLGEAITIPEDFGARQLSIFDVIENNDRDLEDLESNDQDAECDSGFCFL